MPPSGFDYSMVDSLKSFLLQCFQKLQEENTENVRAGLDLERSHIAKALAGDLTALGGNIKATAGTLRIVDAFYEMLQELPARILGDTDVVGLIERILDTGTFLEVFGRFTSHQKEKLQNENRRPHRNVLCEIPFLGTPEHCSETAFFF